MPSVSWQPAIEDALKECESCAVFVGPEGLGPWQREEMRVAVNRRVCDSEQRFRVIPVLLPGAKRESLPAFLLNTAYCWTDPAIESSKKAPRFL
jgi:TIR domain